MLGAGHRLRARSSWAGAPPRGRGWDCRCPSGHFTKLRACLARGHPGHWLGAHAHVHAPPQHRDQAAAVHQVSGRRGRAGRGAQGDPAGGPDPPAPPTARCWRASSTRCRSASRTGRSLPTSWTRTTQKVGPGLGPGLPAPIVQSVLPPPHHSTPLSPHVQSTNEPGTRSRKSLQTR